MNPAGYPQHLPADELCTATSRIDAKSIRDAELGRLSRQYGAIVWWGHYTRAWWGHYTRAWWVMLPGPRRLLDAPTLAALEGQIIRTLGLMR
ncbi:hypothetical protein LUW74_22705 [Actinomadura madurae]|uniref:hypothetical protein n=1 Tax=Actinomadura madurae TaxID=1993 RepID=UPI0020268296|nr:hypothetical protein [Actinomadura madurae]URN05840.1 hypothetical protein LUW74_22705 [Actinomadura madurae]